MHSPGQVQNHRRFGLLGVLFVGLCSVFMLTFSGRIESTDTLFLFNGTASLVRFGDLKLDVGAGVRPPPAGTASASELYPLPDAGAEPLQMLLATPLFWLAQHLPGVGLIHVVYLFNILVSAAACLVLYLYARILGYGEKIGVLAALLLGLATIVWPYSKTFFQEPLGMLWVLGAALLLEKWRASRYRAVGWLLLAGIIGLAAMFSKVSTALALPGLLIIALPRLTWRRLILLMVAVVVLVGVALLGAQVVGISGRVGSALAALRKPGPYVGVALHSYLVSIGGSFWGTSPVILLAIPGVWLSRRIRHAAALLVMAASFALVYAIWQGPDWFGGLSWPPRFLIPVVPFGIIAALPALDHALRRPLPNRLTLLVAALGAYGVWIQLSAVSIAWTAYGHALPPEASGLGEWGGGLNLVRWLRWVVIPSLWPQGNFDFAWARVDVFLWPLAFGVLVLIGGCVLVRWLRGDSLWRWPLAALPITFVLMTFLGLRAIDADPLSRSDDPALRDMLAIIDTEAQQPGDVVLLSDLTYERFFTQNAKSAPPRIVSLPFQRGEQPSPEQPPRVISDNPDVLLSQTTGPLILALAQQRPRLFVLSSSGPFLPWSVRPVERFMAMHYYPLREFATGPQVRLVEFSTIPAPDPFAFLGPTYTTDLVYGDHLRLTGYELPAGAQYAPGAVLPISLYWQADAPLDTDYTVAWFLRKADGEPLAQGWDTVPYMGFAPTSGWHPGVPVWDNRALRLPQDAAPGDYRLWVVVYAAGPDGTITNLPVRGAETRDNHVGVLPITLTVGG